MVAAISGSLVGVFLDQFDLVCQVRGATASSEKRSPLLQAPIRRCALFGVGLDMRGPFRVLVKEWGGAAVQFLSPRIRLRRSEEHTSELQSLMRISYAVFCLKKKKQTHTPNEHTRNTLLKL